MLIKVVKDKGPEYYNISHEHLKRGNYKVLCNNNSIYIESENIKINIPLTKTRIGKKRDNVASKLNDIVNKSELYIYDKCGDGWEFKIQNTSILETIIPLDNKKHLECIIEKILEI